MRPPAAAPVELEDEEGWDAVPLPQEEGRDAMDLFCDEVRHFSSIFLERDELPKLL